MPTDANIDRQPSPINANQRHLMSTDDAHVPTLGRLDEQLLARVGKLEQQAGSFAVSHGLQLQHPYGKSLLQL